MSNLPSMSFAGSAIERRIAAQVLAVFGEPDSLKEQLRPIVYELVAEALPGALRAALPSFLAEIDSALAGAIGKGY